MKQQNTSSTESMHGKRSIFQKRTILYGNLSGVLQHGIIFSLPFFLPPACLFSTMHGTLGDVIPKTLNNNKPFSPSPSLVSFIHIHKWNDDDLRTYEEIYYLYIHDLNASKRCVDA